MVRGARYPKDALLEHSPEDLEHLGALGYGQGDAPDGE